MTTLSRIMVGRAEAARAGLVDSYAWHRALWEAFPHNPDAGRRFLFRVDDRRDAFRVLLLSPDPPTLPDWGSWETKEVAASFLSHSTYRFQLRANPAVKRVTLDEHGERKKNGRRVVIPDEAKLNAWMERKATQAGFELIECQTGTAIATHFTKGDHRGKHVGVDYQGLLCVRDRAAFEAAFHRGIGPAKAFGFGLLMLQPVAEGQ